MRHALLLVTLVSSIASSATLAKAAWALADLQNKNFIAKTDDQCALHTKVNLNKEELILTYSDLGLHECNLDGESLKFKCLLANNECRFTSPLGNVHLIQVLSDGNLIYSTTDKVSKPTFAKYFRYDPKDCIQNKTQRLCAGDRVGIPLEPATPHATPFIGRIQTVIKSLGHLIVIAENRPYIHERQMRVSRVSVSEFSIVKLRPHAANAGPLLIGRDIYVLRHNSSGRYFNREIVKEVSEDGSKVFSEYCGEIFGCNIRFVDSPMFAIAKYDGVATAGQMQSAESAAYEDATRVCRRAGHARCEKAEGYVSCSPGLSSFLYKCTAHVFGF